MAKTDKLTIKIAVISIRVLFCKNNSNITQKNVKLMINHDEKVINIMWVKKGNCTIIKTLDEAAFL